MLRAVFRTDFNKPFISRRLLTATFLSFFKISQNKVDSLSIKIIFA